MEKQAKKTPARKVPQTTGTLPQRHASANKIQFTAATCFAKQVVTDVPDNDHPDFTNRSAITVMKFSKYFDKKRKRQCWRFDVTINGRRYRPGGFAQKKDAEDALAGLQILMQRVRFNLPIAEDSISLWELQAKLQNDKTISKRLCWVFGLFVDLMGKDRSIQRLRRSDLKTFSDHLQESRELGDGSYRHYMLRVRAALNRAGDYFPSLETWKAPKLPKLPADTKRSRIVKKNEIAAFLTVLSRPWPHDRPGTQQQRLDLCDIIRLMLLLGARREEIVKITLKKIDRDERTLWLWSSKTKKDHLIPLSESALKILLSRPPAPNGTLFRTELLTSFIARTMARASEWAELPFGRVNAWTLHDLRRTSSVVIEQAGIPYSAIQDLLGHSRKGTTSTYTPAQWEDLQRAIQELESWCRDIDGMFQVSGEGQRPPATLPEIKVA